MKVIEFIKQKQMDFQQSNAEFRALLEPKIKDWSQLLNDTFTNTLNNPWMSRFNPFEDEKHESTDSPAKPLVMTAQTQAMHDELIEQLGQQTFLGQWYLVDQSCIDQFAQVTGDAQWIHTDLERAKRESPFKTTIAHGFLTLALIPTLTDTVNPDSNPYPNAKMAVNYGLNRVRFPSPVKSGTLVRARTRLIAITPMRKSIEVISEVSIEIENSKRVACIAETVLRLYFN
ncbi:MAG: MaoC family dehydratase [Gammaproteobacteria bacterium]|nr:MaoC family dehydratase [Gammaproteobacteria bacterium]